MKSPQHLCPNQAPLHPTRMPRHPAAPPPWGLPPVNRLELKHWVSVAENNHIKNSLSEIWDINQQEISQITLNATVPTCLLCLAAPGLRTPLAMPCSYPSPFGMVAHPGINGELGGAGAAYTGLHNISPQMSAVAAAAVAAYGRTQVVLKYIHPYLFHLGLFSMWFSCLDLQPRNVKHGGMCCIWLSRIFF